MDILTLLLILGAFLITFCASCYIKTNYNRYKKEIVTSGKTGYDVAREILDKNNLSHILILEVPGELTDHYDPSKKVVKLSHDIYNEASIAAVSVAAHECGHALQDKDGYAFLKFRNTIVPLVNFSSKVGYLAIVIGIFFSLVDLIWVGIAFEMIILLFQLVTLPVEFDASKRALNIIDEMHIVNKNELDGSKKMLTSAALTYVAGVISTVMELLRLVLSISRRR